MPLNYNNEQPVTRLYLRTTERKWVGTGYPGGYVPVYDGAEIGGACLTLGQVVMNSDGQYLICNNVYINKEVLTLKDTSNNIIHNRTTYTFDANGGTGGEIQTKTFGVESVTPPTGVSRSGYSLTGWQTSTGTPVSFPFIAGTTNETYYAQWVSSKTSNPTIVPQVVAGRFRVRNDDASPATIYASTSNPPTTNRGVIDSGASTLNILLANNQTLYAYAVVDGKSPSDTVHWLYQTGDGGFTPVDP